MAGGVNKVILIGNLGKDPEVRFTPSGAAVANFNIATNESWTDKSGQKQERTEWLRIVTFSKLAEIAAEYLRKGSKVYVEGSIRTRKWQDKEGQDRYSTEIRGDRMQMLGGRQGMGEAPARDAGGGSGGSRPAPAAQPAGGGFNDFEDDIPF